MKENPAVAGVILAAGSSVRMGRPKALLTVAGTTFLERIVDVSERADLEPLRIVVGEHAHLIREACPELGPRFIINPAPQQGQLSSLQLGLTSLLGEPRPAAAVVFLVDHPLVRVETVQRLVAAFRNTGRGIVVPSMEGRRGHPTLFGSSIFQALLSAPLERGARGVIEARPEDVLEVAADDPGILVDIDTPADFGRHLGGEV